MQRRQRRPLGAPVCSAHFLRIMTDVDTPRAHGLEAQRAGDGTIPPLGIVQYRRVVAHQLSSVLVRLPRNCRPG